MMFHNWHHNRDATSANIMSHLVAISWKFMLKSAVGDRFLMHQAIANVPTILIETLGRSKARRKRLSWHYDVDDERFKDFFMMTR